MSYGASELGRGDRKGHVTPSQLPSGTARIWYIRRKTAVKYSGVNWINTLASSCGPPWKLSCFFVKTYTPILKQWLMVTVANTCQKWPALHMSLNQYDGSVLQLHTIVRYYDDCLSSYHLLRRLPWPVSTLKLLTNITDLISSIHYRNRNNVDKSS